MKPFSWKLGIVSMTLLISLSSVYGQATTTEEASAENAQIDQEILARGIRGYQANLRSEVDAIVESAVLHAAIMCLKFPDQDYAKIVDELRRLSFAATNPRLRYKAYLAATIMPNPGQFLDRDQCGQLLLFNDETSNEFFAIVAAALQYKLAD